eukprot:gene55439-11494_t
MKVELDKWLETMTREDTQSEVVEEVRSVLNDDYVAHGTGPNPEKGTVTERPKVAEYTGKGRGEEKVMRRVYPHYTRSDDKDKAVAIPEGKVLLAGRRVQWIERNTKAAGGERR